MASTYLSYSTITTPQTEPIPGSTQVANEAGGYAFPVDNWTRFQRFLILGSENGTYYVGERELTRQNAQSIERCLKEDGLRTVALIEEVSKAGRAAKNDPALFALALAMSIGDDATRQAVITALPNVARTGTHLLHFVAYAQQFRGWGRGLRKAISNWYLSKSAADLAYQLVKYQSRDKWSHRDLLRLAHPHAAKRISMQQLFGWATHGWPDVGDEPHDNSDLQLVWAFEKAKRVSDSKDVVRLICEYRLPREAIPTEMLVKPEVWAALLEDMPLTAMIRNLATMTRIGLLTDFSSGTGLVETALRDSERLRKSRIHPVQVLAALKTYAQGYGDRGKNTWTPARRVVDALDSAFYAAFGNVEPTGKRWMLGLDVSGSMTGTVVNGVPGLSCHDAQASMALVIASVESQWSAVAFDTNLYPLTISPRQRLDDVIKYIRQLGHGGTDCALPIAYAIDKQIPVDVFVIFTDSETWAGQRHPVQAITQYRRKMGIPAKLIVVAMASTGTSIADSADAGMLNVVGFDTVTPNLIADFART